MAACSPSAPEVSSEAALRARIDSEMRIHQIQVLGSHNSYKQAIEAPLLARIAEEDPEQAAGLDYSHPPVRLQLDLGLRNLELDVFYDPEGGRYASPLGLDLAAQAGQAPAPHDPGSVLEAPGFKVLHVQDIDFRSHCLTLQACLEEIRIWSEAHPDHLPLFLTVNAKDQVIDRPGFSRPLPFDAAAFDALDAELRSGLGPGRLVVPDEVRGAHASLDEAVRAGAWPTLGEARGRVLVVLDEGGDKLRAYTEGHPGLAGRAMFVDAPEGTPEAGVRIVNDPLGSYDTIRRLVRAGYLVRTRADADTYEARTGRTTRRDSAWASGAQVVTTDYYRPDPRFGTGYVVRMPGGTVARCHPFLAPPYCRSDLLE